MSQLEMLIVAVLFVKHVADRRVCKTCSGQLRKKQNFFFRTLYDSAMFCYMYLNLYIRIIIYAVWLRLLIPNRGFHSGANGSRVVELDFRTLFSSILLGHNDVFMHIAMCGQ